MDERRWFTELINGTHGLTIRVDREIVSVQTPFQKLEIFENETLGRVMLLDGLMMLTERDEFTYHEMLVHPALLAHPAPRRVLIVGGGDGGTLREVVKHPEVEQAVLCEIDADVIRFSKEHLPFVACGFDSPKALLHIGDGVQYIREHRQSFDVIIIDSTDPVGFAEGLFRAPFHRDCLGALRDGGVFVQQAESPFFDLAAWRRGCLELKTVFSQVHIYTASMPVYPSGTWTFAFAAQDRDPWHDFNPARFISLPGLRYYHPELQTKAFALPRFARELLGD